MSDEAESVVENGNDIASNILIECIYTCAGRRRMFFYHLFHLMQLTIYFHIIFFLRRKKVLANSI